MAEENQTGLKGLLRNFTGAASDKEVKFLGRAGPRSSDDQPDFFKDLFLNRAGGGGKDYMVPEKAVDFKKYYKEDGGFGSLDAPEGVSIFTSADQAKKINLSMAEEKEAERILPLIYDQAMKVVDAALDIDDEDEKMRIINDINRSFDKTEGSGFARSANSYYRIVQKYGYLLNKDRMGRAGGIGNLPPKSMMIDTTTSAFGDAGRGRKVPSFLREEARANGGRIGYQTGGVTEVRDLPPEFVEAAQKTFLTDLSRQAGIPSITTATTQQPGETAEQFANRQAQAQQFQITKAGMAELAPRVAKQDALQTAARTQAVDPTTGLGSFQPFLTKAATAADAATGLTGPMTAAQTTAYTSPFQQQVIDATREEFDKQAQIRRNQLAASALDTPGAFGGGREGVQRAEFDAASDANRARILADLRQRGFQQAQTARQQDIANQLGIAQLQSGLGGSAQDFARAQIAGLGGLGAQEQAQQQAIIDANRQAAAMAVQDPRDRLGMFGTGIAQITPGAGGVRLEPTAATAPAASPLMTALGVGLAGADIYGRIFGPRKS
jgi:hypothetical protein